MSGAKKLDFFKTLEQHARAAERAGGVQDVWHRIAGRVLRIRFLGNALEQTIAPALEHCRLDPPGHAPNLTLECWDCESLRLPFPMAPVGKQAFMPRGEVTELSDARFHTAYEPGGRLLSVMDAQARHAFYCIGSASKISRFEAAEPIRSILSWFMRAHGRLLVHAAAVGYADGGALLIGRSGAGKSNTSLGCLNAGMGLLADDFCAVSMDCAPMAHSLYCTAKTHPEDMEKRPFLRNFAPQRDPSGRDKTIYFLKRAEPERLLAEFPIKALLMLQKSDGETRLAPTSPAAVLAGSAPDTARLLAGAGPEVLRTLSQLVRRLPCYTLLLGSNPAAIPVVIERLLHERRDAR